MDATPPPRRPVRVIYTDMDGTMLGPWGSLVHALDDDATPVLTLEPVTALVDLHRARVPLVLVSGRHAAGLRDLCTLLSAEGFVGEMGGVIGWDRGHTWEVLRGAMPDDLPGTPWDVIHAAGLVEELHRRFDLEYHAPWHLNHQADVLLRGNADVAEVEAWLTDQGFGWLVMLDNGVLPAAEAGRRGVHVWHLLPRGLGKGQGVVLDLARRGLGPADAIAIGDSLSDLDMAPAVGRMFLVANGAAHPHVRRAAERLDNVTVCDESVGHGWVQAVRWALGGR
jgi:hypothetical protein